MKKCILLVSEEKLKELGISTEALAELWKDADVIMPENSGKQITLVEASEQWEKYYNGIFVFRK